MDTQNDNLKQLVRDFFRILEKEEISDSGKKFRTTNITSCRVMDTQNLNILIDKIKKIVGE